VERQQVALLVEDRRDDRDVDHRVGAQRVPKPPLGLRDRAILLLYHARQ
jgi:hypothetical protein